MSSKIDHAKRQFESTFLKEFAALTRFPQTTALRIARDNVEDILIMYNDAYSPLETARYLCKLINIDEIREAPSFSASAGWR